MTIDQLSTDMLLRAQSLGMASSDSGIDATNFTGRFRVQSTLQGVILDNSTGSLSFRTANNLSDTTRLLTTDNQSLTVEMLNADNEVIYTETISFDITDASVSDAVGDGFSINTPEKSPMQTRPMQQLQPIQKLVHQLGLSKNQTFFQMVNTSISGFDSETVSL